MKIKTNARILGLAFLLTALSAASLHASMPYEAGSESGGVAAGAAVTGGTASRLMSTDSSGNVQTHTGTRFDGTTLTLQGAALSVAGNVTLSSMSVVDATNASFGAVTAASTSTLTWTEVTDRLSEFVTSSFTAITAGYYEIAAESGASQTAGTGCLLLKVNGTTIANGDVCVTGATALATVLTLSMNRILNLSANDIVRIDASATTANVTFQKMNLTIRRIP